MAWTEFVAAWTSSKSFSSLFQSSLTGKTLVRMSSRIASVIAMSAGLSYFHGMSVLQSQVSQDLAQYIQERGQEESARFLLAQDNLKTLQTRFNADLKQPIPNATTQFEQTFFTWNDRTLRNFPQTRAISEFDSLRFPTASIGRDLSGQPPAITPELQQRIMMAYSLIGSYGAAWTNRFADLYYVSPENININYWPGYTSALTAPADLYHPKEEYFYLGDPTHNRDRKIAWTGVYLDPGVKVWMVSAILPLYEGDRFLGIIGHDIPLTTLLTEITARRRTGTTNMIVREDGYLIAHGDYKDKIEQAKGQLAIAEVRDPHLQRIFQLVKQKNKQSVIENTTDDEYIAVTHLKGPDWYFITIFPKTLLSPQALSLTGFVLLSGIVVLGAEMMLLRLVLRHEIAQPLQQLTAASDHLADGDFTVALDIDRQDELGHLARAFTRMTGQLKTSFGALETANTDLENRVADRTKALQKAMAELSQTQAQMVHNEKMSSLGKTVAGVAHEINNPVNFIHGNLTHVNRYAQDLLKLTGLYQQHYPEPGDEIMELLEDLDLPFLREDIVKVIGSMRMGTERIREIILSLRNFSRLDEAAVKSVNIHDGIESTLLILQHRFQESAGQQTIEIIRDYGTLPMVNCHVSQINQVLMNLIANAVDAVSSIKNSQIRITTEVGGKGDLVHIMVADNGSGIAPEVQSKIFDPFFTTKDVGQGTGLGLSISYQIITELHGGKLWCESILGEGTIFHIEIPIDLTEKSIQPSR
jgi:two-component system, NtrC family, sensor kinase